jgi:predicted TIM-barrel fold metal-dependent hydrolase
LPKLLRERLGTSRNVVVTPSTYGTDNRVTLDAMAQIGATARGVAVVDTSVSDSELKRLNDLGVRGIRFNLVQAGATTVEMIEPLSKRINDLGWHIQIHMKGEQIAGIEDLLLRVPSPIVFDHLGRLAQPNALDSPGFKTISKLIDKGKTWVKLSGAYQDSKVGPPSYSDTIPVARAYIKAAPQRMVWGHIRARRKSRTMRSSSTCSRNGRQTPRRARLSWCRTPPRSMGSPCRHDRRLFPFRSFGSR